MKQLVKCQTNAITAHEDVRTGPAQKMSEGHHACVGGSATSEGKGVEAGAVALAIAVESVILGAPVLISRVDA